MKRMISCPKCAFKEHPSYADEWFKRVHGIAKKDMLCDWCNTPINADGRQDKLMDEVEHMSINDYMNAYTGNTIHQEYKNWRTQYTTTTQTTDPRALGQMQYMQAVAAIDEKYKPNNLLLLLEDV